MNNFRQQLFELLNSLYPTYSVHDEESTEMPFLTYRVYRNDNYYQRNDFVAVIDVYASEIEQVEKMCDDIFNLLAYNSFTNDVITTTFYLDSERYVEESQKYINRRQIQLRAVSYELQKGE